MWCTLLDPRYNFKSANWKNDDEKKRAKNLLVKEVKQLAHEDTMNEHQGLVSDTDALSSSAKSQGGNCEREDEFSFQSYTKKRLASVDTSAELQIMEEVKVSLLAGQEFETYLMDIDGCKKSDFNPLEWWHMNHKRYPNVVHAARKWVSVSGTSSTPSE